MKNIRFLSAAEEEMNYAAAYYEEKAPNLGLEFLKEIRRVTKTVSTHPELGPVIEAGIRRRILKRFPFALLYKTDSTEIIILAVMHLARNPGYWRGRGQ